MSCPFASINNKTSNIIDQSEYIHNKKTVITMLSGGILQMGRVAVLLQRVRAWSSARSVLATRGDGVGDQSFDIRAGPKTGHVPEHHLRHLAQSLVAALREPDLDAGGGLRVCRRALHQPSRCRDHVPRSRALRRLSETKRLVSDVEPHDARDHQGRARETRRRGRTHRQIHE